MSNLRLPPPCDERGFTMVEVIATIVILSIVIPALYVSYMTVVRTGAMAATRLRCVNVARQEVEQLKAEDYLGLLASIPTGQDSVQRVQPDYETTGIDVTTTISKTTVTAEECTADALLVNVIAAKGRVRVPIDFLLVEEGY